MIPAICTADQSSSSDQPTTQAQPRQLKFGETLYVRMNGSVSNELIMPWESTWKLAPIPEGSDATTQLIGRSLFVSLGSEQHLQLFLRDASQEDSPKYSVMIDNDKTFGPQQIVLAIDSGSGFRVSSKPRVSSDYVQHLVELQRMQALGSYPQGFVVDMPSNPVDISIGDVRGHLVERMSGSLFGQEWTLEKYLLENIGGNLIELNENNFHMPGVRATSFWEKLRLLPREKSYLLIVRDRSGEKR